MPRAKQNDDWQTPSWLFKALDAEFAFTVDVASTDKNALCLKHFTPETCGLTTSWSGERVFCNPPYSNIRPWVEKAVSREAQISVLLLPIQLSRIGTMWLRLLLEFKPYVEIRAFRKRVAFINAIGQEQQGTPFDSFIAVLR